MISVSLEFGATEGCCGVTQIYSFSNVPWSHGLLSAQGATAEEAYQNLFNQLLEYDFESEDGGTYDCAVLQIWFYRGRDFNGVDNAEYEAEPFRKLIEQIPNVSNLGVHRNPNSGNLIQGYQWSVR
jgi:hypothetical protein